MAGDLERAGCDYLSGAQDAGGISIDLEGAEGAHMLCVEKTAAGSVAS